MPRRLPPSAFLRCRASAAHFLAAVLLLSPPRRRAAAVPSGRAPGRVRPRPRAPAAFLPARAVPARGTALWGGRGRTDSYAWTEDTFNIEISFPVPAGTASGDVAFAPHLERIGLSAAGAVLMDASRPLRGKVVLDETYWTLTDGPEAEGAFALTDYGTDGRRVLTVVLEKDNMVGGIEVDEDWGGIFEDQNVAGDNQFAPTEADPVVEYEEEDDALDVDRYTRRLGVDPSKINEEDIDKSMYSGFEMQEDLLQNLQTGGFVKDVMDQTESPEYVGDRPIEQDGGDGDGGGKPIEVETNDADLQ